MNMFWQHYLENNTPNFSDCIPKQVYAAIWSFQKITIFFGTTKPTFNASSNFLGMIFVRLQERSKDKQRCGRHLLKLASQL